MKSTGRKVGLLVLVGILLVVLAAPAAFADSKISLSFNGQDYVADMYVENGLSYISAVSLTSMLGIDIEQEGYVPLRQFFESRGGKVLWDATKNQVIVSLQVTVDGLSADDLVLKSTALLQELNTYKMKGTSTIEMNVTGPAMTEVPEIPEISVAIDGVFQQEPMAMYIIQTMEMPLADMGMSDEELAMFEGQGSMVTEMVWSGNSIYQKMPFADQWIVQDLGEMDMMGDLTNLMQVTPQQSLEMMRQFGIVNAFGDDKVIDGIEYYTVKNSVDSTAFKKVIQELLGGFNLDGLEEQEGMTDINDEMQQTIQALLATMEINYYIENYINKDSLITERMFMNMEMKYELDETLSPEAPMSFHMFMKGDFELYDFGVEIKLPDVSNAITQAEYMEQMMQMMEPIPGVEME